MTKQKIDNSEEKQVRTELGQIAQALKEQQEITLRKPYDVKGSLEKLVIQLQQLEQECY